MIGQDGSQLGIVPLKKALDLAAEDHLDLVEVAPNANPPVCKIMDYGKFKYQQSKRSQEAKKSKQSFRLKKSRFVPRPTNTTCRLRFATSSVF